MGAGYSSSVQCGFLQTVYFLYQIYLFNYDLPDNCKDYVLHIGWICLCEHEWFFYKYVCE